MEPPEQGFLPDTPAIQMAILGLTMAVAWLAMWLVTLATDAMTGQETAGGGKTPQGDKHEETHPEQGL